MKKTIRDHFKIKNPVINIVLLYIIFVIVGMFVLKFDILLNPGHKMGYIDALFTSISSLATTGLTVVDIGEYYNFLGWIVLIILFNIGGMGIMTINTILFILVGKKIGIKNRMLAQIDSNKIGMNDVVSIIKTIFSIFITAELIGTFLIFLKLNYLDMNIFERFMNSLFMSASAITGSGFYDTVPYKDDYFVLTVLIILMIFSFIGYPVFIDIKEYIKHKKSKTKKKYYFSSFTKIVVKINLITILVFAFLFLIMEFNNTMIDYNIAQKIYYSLYMSVSTKSVGLTLFNDVTSFNNLTNIFFIIFMIIGGSPSSACGGIRVTTVYIIFVYTRSQFKGHKQAIFKQFYLSENNILRAYNVVFIFLLISFLGFLSIVAFSSADEYYLFYDVISAITTTGFSTGVTSKLNNMGLIIMIILMFIGRIGIMNLIGIFNSNKNKNKRVKYIQKEVII